MERFHKWESVCNTYSKLKTCGSLLGTGKESIDIFYINTSILLIYYAGINAILALHTLGHLIQQNKIIFQCVKYLHNLAPWCWLPLLRVKYRYIDSFWINIDVHFASKANYKPKVNVSNPGEGKNFSCYFDFFRYVHSQRIMKTTFQVMKTLTCTKTLKILLHYFPIDRW